MPTSTTSKSTNRLRRLAAASLFVLATGAPVAAWAAPIGPGPGEISDQPQEPTCHLPQGCDLPDDKKPPVDEPDDACADPSDCLTSNPGDPDDGCNDPTDCLTSNPGDPGDEPDDDNPGVDPGDTVSANPDFTG